MFSSDNSLGAKVGKLNVYFTVGNVFICVWHCMYTGDRRGDEGTV